MNRKTCYCINPSCKCVYGCGCTLADKSVGKCMCCVMEETNYKIDKLRRKKTTITKEVGPSPPEPSPEGTCGCDDKYDTIFYDIIVKTNSKEYYSTRYGCSVIISNDDNNIVINSDTVPRVCKEISVNLTYDHNVKYEYLKVEEVYNMVFVDEESLKCNGYSIDSDNVKTTIN